MERKKRFSVLKLLITIVCIASIIVSAAVNILFAGGKTPKIFGRYIYVIGEDNPMAGELTTGAALISMDASKVSIATGDIILCYPADNPSNLCLRSVSFAAEGEDGSLSYYTKDSFHEDTEGSITKDKIAAVCTGYPESKELGRFINFALDMKGRIILLGVTGLILVIFIISAILRSRSSDDEEDEEDFGFYEYDEDDEDTNRRTKSADPLYDPNPAVSANPEFERKKMSIAENFTQKQVNPESPYQKEREKERTMQFKAQKSGSLGSTMSFSTTSTAESSFAARNPGNISSSAPTAETLREEMLRKTAEAERTGTYNIRKPAETVSDNTGILSAAQVAELRGGNAPSRAAETKFAAPKKSSSPDISDILGKSSPRSSKKPSDMSVDDLLKMIEDEKNRL